MKGHLEAVITPESKVVLRQAIRCYDVDGAMRLKPAAFMDLAQEMAYITADLMHFGYDELQQEGKAWVLSRMHFTFVDVPVWRDEVEIQTWHKGPSGPFYLRDFRINDLQGNAKVLGTSSWVILDVRERRMCRTSEVTEMIPESTVCHDFAIEAPAEKVAMPRGIQPEAVASHKVGYADVDLLGHTNNARYVVWAMECIDYELVASRPIKDLWVNFNHETRAGEEVTLFRHQEGDTYFVEGKVEDRQAFCVKIQF